MAPYVPVSVLFVVLIAVVGTKSAEPQEPPRVGFIAPCRVDEPPGPETAAASRLAAKLYSAPTLFPAANGRFVDSAGKAVSLDTLDVLWHHQGDSSTATGPMYEKAAVDALRQYVEQGRGLFLSGAALGMVHTMGIEPIAPRRGGPGNDQNAADVVPVRSEHPVFKQLAMQGGVVRLSDAGYPAFADFHGRGGPSRGMVLARTPGASENPLVEYRVGKGRVIVMGWRLPHYANTNNAHRENLQRITANILDYLATPERWQRVVISRVPGQPAVEPGVAASQWRVLRMAVDDLSRTQGERYPNGSALLAKIDALRKSHDAVLDELSGTRNPDEELPADTFDHLDRITAQFARLRTEALLANPLLDFDRLLLVKRSPNHLGLPANYLGNGSLPQQGYDNEIAVLSPIGVDGKLTTLYRPEGGRFVGDVDLHFDADRMLVSMPGDNGRWQVFEIDADGQNPRQLPLVHEPDVDNYDACYLPDGNIIFSSTAPFVGVPCVGGSSHVANLFRLDRTTGAIRQLTFDQDHNWCPTVLGNGRVMYLRWEYSDIPHYVSRILFQMNPDGSDQAAYYGSNSYWPNAMFYARPIPGHPTQFAAIVGGHHDVPRMGELVLFDPARGRHEADGAIQHIPGFGKQVEPIIRDGLVRGSWPKFLHPWPLSEKYFIVSAQPTAASSWGIYLVDTFDNMVLLHETPGYALLEPIPFKARPIPPTVSSALESNRDDATVYLADVYSGPGLAGIPRGTVKRLRLFTYHFAYHGMGGQINRVGLDGPWDIKRVLGTVPVEADGSALFRVPANTPISVQPLDGEGKALQVMRSWMTAMPGEVLSCVGCHQTQNRTPPARATIAAAKPPVAITPWYGPTRGFSFVREVQPVLNGHCVGCHDGRSGAKDGNSPEAMPDFRDRPPEHPHAVAGSYNAGTQFPPAYMALRRFVRGATIESDMHLLEPGEFHADTSKLVQILRKGHYGVELDAEAWDRLITWIDLNTPAHGTWHEIVGSGKVDHQRARRMAMLKQYAGRDEDPETVIASAKTAITPITPIVPDKTVERRAKPVTCPDWPFDEEEAKQRQRAAGTFERSIDLGGGVSLEMVLIPAGQFVMGNSRGDGYADEGPVSAVSIDRPFWMGRFEVTNAQFARFDPAHDSRIEPGDFLQFGTRERGYPVNGPEQPVVRVSQVEAVAFVQWLSTRTGLVFSLPAEDRWEWAARAGNDEPRWGGSADGDLASRGNFADASLRKVDRFGWGLPDGAVPPWRPADVRYNDGHRVSAPVGSYKPNPWGLFDMHGNAAEWTGSVYRAYPLAQKAESPSAAELPNHTADRVAVRGGSWYDRPKRCRATARLAYWPYQKVFDVGFRVVCEATPDGITSADGR